MPSLAAIIRALQTAAEGTADLDHLIGDAQEIGATSRARTARRYTRSLDAALPGEVVVRVERLTRRQTDRWRAWLDNGWSADGNTEVLARRLAWLTWLQAAQKAAHPEPRKPRRDDRRRRGCPPEEASGVEAIAAPPAAGERSAATNDKLIIDALCEHIRRLTRDSPGHHVQQDFPDAATGEMTIRVIRHPRFQPAPASAPRAASALLSEGISAWHLEARPTVKNLDRVQRAGRRFIEIYGDRPMDTYTKAEVRQFLNHIRNVPKWPPQAIRNMPLPVVLRYAAANPDVARVTPRTVRAYLKDLQLLFNWSMACDLCSINPANNLRVIDRRIQSELRVAYDLADLKLIFEQSPMYRGCKAAHLRRIPGDLVVKDSVFWFPLFALFSGARLGEIALATVGDFKVEGAVSYLDIHAAGDNRHLKTQSSDRRIPIHPELIHMGLLDFVGARGPDKTQRVFEKVEGRRDIRTVHGWSQAWQIYQAGLGIDDRRKVFHSFRHSFKLACRDAGIEEEVHDAITGHRAYWSGRRYGQGISLATAAAAMDRVRYNGLELSHLHQR